MVKKMRAQSLVSAGLFVVFLVCAAVAVGAATISEQCSDAFTKVGSCLNYATAKVATPTKECCGAVTDIKANNPVCLCYFIQQANNGSQQIRSMGIQVSRLLQLPSACQLANASVSDCPKLLNIPKSSPDYAIFTNSSASSTTPSTTTGTSSPASASDSSRSKHGPQLAGLVGIAMAIFLCVFPIELGSTW